MYVLWLEILTGNSRALDFCENIQSGGVLHADSNDIKIVCLSRLGGGADTKRPPAGSPFSDPVLRISVTSFHCFIALPQRLSLPGTFLFKSPSAICIRIRTVGQSPDPPRLWRALMLFRTPRRARNALARCHFH